MKRFLVIQFLVLFACGVSLAESLFNINGLRFGAPTVNGKGNIYAPEVGDIVYDSSDSKFYGFTQASAWLDLSANAAADSVPVGTVMPFAGTSAPTGYLIADGGAVSRTAYAALFAIIGTTYGAGDGSTTFNLPNTQGVFVRGAGSQTISSITYSGTLATKQGDQVQGHRHRPSTTAQNQSFTVNLIGGAQTVSAFAGTTVNNAPDVSDPISDGTNGTPRTGSETRPANISLNYIIKH